MTSPAPLLSHPRPRPGGFALVSTVLIVAVLTIMVVAFLQSMRIDQMTARSYLNKARADEAARAGLLMGLGTLGGYRDAGGAWVPHNDFSFAIVPITGTLGNTNEELQLVKLGGPAGTEISRHALSNGGTTTTQVRIHAGPANIRRDIRLVEIDDGSSRFGARAGFFVEDESGKLNVRQALGRTRYEDLSGALTVNSLRSNLETLQQLPFIPPNTSTLTSTDNLSVRHEVFAQILDPDGFFPETTYFNYIQFQNPKPTELIDRARYTSWSSAPIAAPDGGPRLDLRRLKFYVDQLASTQATNNPKSRVVEALVGTGHTGLRSNWGGGHLEWLRRVDPEIGAAPGAAPYTETQAKQIAANLIDWIDKDKIPTTDNVDAPTYFGVEAWFDPPSGTIKGHPIFNMVGTGMVFNRSDASGSVGGLNSTRVLAFVGLVNPWASASLRFDTFYDFEISIEIQGQATGGLLGSSASAYFLQDLNERFDVYPTALGTPPMLQPNQGFTFPNAPSGLNYANLRDLRVTVGRQPPGMRFSNLAYRINKLRLIFTDTDGVSGVVQVLDNLKTTDLPADPVTANMGASSGPLTYKFTNRPNKQDFHLSTDPRLNFLASSWSMSRSTAASGDGIPVPQNVPDLFTGATDDPADGAQGLTVNHTWFTSPATNKHFRGSSPPEITDPIYIPNRAPETNGWAVRSIGEIGFLHTGLPWRTLRLFPSSTATQKDWKLLDFLTTGSLQTTPDPHRPNTVHAPGLINLNTANRTALLSLFTDIPGVTDGSNRATAATLADEFITYRASTELLHPGRIALWPRLTNSKTDDFEKEALIRRIIAAATTTSRTFTVYGYGEATAGNRVLARSLIAAEVILESQPDGTIKPKILNERNIQ